MRKFIAFVLLVGFGLLGVLPTAYADDTNYGGIVIDSNSDPATTSSTKVFTINDTSGSEVFSITAAGVISVGAAISLTVNITTSGDIQGEEVIGTQYIRIPYFAKASRPASGAPLGSTIWIYGLTATDCSNNPGANTIMNLCMSDGFQWRAV